MIAASKDFGLLPARPRLLPPPRADAECERAPKQSAPAQTAQAVSLSLANTIGVLGIHRELVVTKVLENLPGLLKFTAAVQTVLGIVLLFLFGLGIRNRFRMK